MYFEDALKDMMEEYDRKRFPFTDTEEEEEYGRHIWSRKSKGDNFNIIVKTRMDKEVILVRLGTTEEIMDGIYYVPYLPTKEDLESDDWYVNIVNPLIEEDTANYAPHVGMRFYEALKEIRDGFDVHFGNDVFNKDSDFSNLTQEMIFSNRWGETEGWVKEE